MQHSKGLVMLQYNRGEGGLTFDNELNQINNTASLEDNINLGYFDVCYPIVGSGV